MRFLQQWLHEGELFFQQTIQRNSNAFRLWHSRETEILLQHLTDAQYLRTHFAQEYLTFVCAPPSLPAAQPFDAPPFAPSTGVNFGSRPTARRQPRRIQAA